jgi:hypothetical protein
LTHLDVASDSKSGSIANLESGGGKIGGSAEYKITVVNLVVNNDSVQDG